MEKLKLKKKDETHKRAFILYLNVAYRIDSVAVKHLSLPVIKLIKL